MRKALLLAFILLAFIPPVKAVSFWQYNETAESSSSAGSWTSVSNTNDTDWGTYGEVVSTGSWSEVTFYHRKANLTGLNLSQTQTKWQVKDGLGAYNLTINYSGCWSYNATHLVLIIRSNKGGTAAIASSYYYCYDGGYQTIALHSDAGGLADNIYEDGMWWKFEALDDWLSLNFSQSVTGTYTFSNMTTAASFSTSWLEINLSEQATGKVIILLENQSISFNNSYASFKYNVTLLNGTIKWQKYKIMTSDAIGLANAFVKVLDASTNGLVFSGFSDDAGYVHVPLNLMKPYRFNVTLGGYIDHVDTKYIYTSDETEEQVVLTTPSLIYDYWNYFDKISYSCAQNITTTDVNCTANDTSGLVSQFCLNVGRWTLNGFVNQCFVCNATTANGKVGCDITNTTGNKTYTYQFTASFPDGSEYLLYNGQISFISGAAIYGLNGVFIALMLILTMAFVGLWSPAASIIGGSIGLVLSAWLNLIVLSPVIIIGIVIVGAMIVIRGRY